MLLRGDTAGMAQAMEEAAERAGVAEIRLSTQRSRLTRKLLDELMRSRTQTIMATIPQKQRAEVLNALELLNNAIGSAGCCALNAPIATLTNIKGQK